MGRYGGWLEWAGAGLVVLLFTGCHGREALAPDAAPGADSAEAAETAVAPDGEPPLAVWTATVPEWHVADAVEDSVPSLYISENLDHPRIRALAPLVALILRDYGNPTTSLDKARALRDWVARTAIAGPPALHPNGSRANLNVLPRSATWTDVNAIADNPARALEDSQWWNGVTADGTEQLRRLLGDYDSVRGRWLDNGLMRHHHRSRFEIRDIRRFHYVLCSFQVQMLVSLWAAAGLYGMQVTTVGHDGAAVFIPELHGWVWQDPQFNEEFVEVGSTTPITPLRLRALSLKGHLAAIEPRKTIGPVWSRDIYADPQRAYGATYFRASGMVGMLALGVQVDNRQAGRPYFAIEVVTVKGPYTAMVAPLNTFRQARWRELFPTFGVAVELRDTASATPTVAVRSTQPDAVQFEWSFDWGAWVAGPATITLPASTCRVLVRSVDRFGNPSATARIRNRRRLAMQPSHCGGDQGT